MTSVLVAAIVLLFVLCLVNLALLFAVVRRLRAVEETAVAPSPLPQIGTTVSDLSAATADGGRITRSDVADADALVAFVTQGCSPCATVVEQLGAGRQDVVPVGRVFVFIVAETPEAPGEADREYAAALSSAARVAFVADSGPQSAAFGGVTAFPTLLRVHDGKVAAAGHRLADLRATTAPAG